MTPRVLVAGIGNIFLGDDAFGVEVVQRLKKRALPPDVRVVDFGIRGIHLAYELLDHPCELLVLVDATTRGDRPGTLYLIDPALEGTVNAEGAAGAHGMTPDVVLATLRTLGATMPTVRIVGCEPQTIFESMGLSPCVEAAVETAVEMVVELFSMQIVERPVA